MNKAAERKCKTCEKVFAKDVEVCPDCGGKLEEHDALIGTIFAEKYEILSILGRGGMSVVYKARHKYMNRVVAVKLLLEHLSDDPTAFARFQKEAQAASSLSHQNIVSVHDFGVADGKAYFVMDCLEGDTLYDVIVANKGLPLDRAVDIFRQTCDGLAHAHKKGIVHRDLKPSNVVLVNEDDGSETAKIVDFGLAKLHKPEGAEEARLTQSGMVFGSPLYMSPEQCQGMVLDARSDVYSLGVMMYETLAGSLPFQSDSFFNIALLHIHSKPPSFADSAPDKHVPAGLEAVIFKCLEKEPANRYDNVEELRQKILDSALIGGVPGLKAGAVPVADSGKQSPFRSTFENMKAIVASGGAVEHAKKTSLTRLVVYATIGVFIVGSVFSFFFFPGAEGDHGTPYEKLRWQLDLELAGKSIQAGDYIQADKLLQDARALASNFGDRHARLKMTLERQADMYNGWSKFPEAEKANQAAAAILTEQIVAEADEVAGKFRGFAEPSDSQTERQMDKMHAVADTLRLATSSKRLASRNLFRQEESLLKTGMDALDRLQMNDSSQMADLDALMADCLVAQQRLSEVRPFLVKAEQTRKKLVQEGDITSKRKYAKSLLQLGQFDRDQSNYADASKELQTALAMTRKDFSNDRALLAGCLNAYADLLRQTGKAEEGAALVIEAKELHANGDWREQ
jgi:tRNA A-37 threonylcarbamoyl transferase component Bud32